MEPVHKLRGHPAVEMGQGITLVRNPHQHLRHAIRAQPPERLVLPLAENRADAVEVIRRVGQIADARLVHRRHSAPCASRHIADHRRVDRHAGELRELCGMAEQSQQFLRPAKPGELVGIHAVELDLTGLHRSDEGGALGFIWRLRKRSAAHKTSTFQTKRAPSG